MAGQTIGRSSSETNSRTGSLLIGGEGQRQQIGGRLERGGQQSGESFLGHGQLIGRNRQAAFDDVKNSLRGAAVALRIVQNSLRQAVRLQIRRGKRVAAERQRHHARQPGPVQQKRVAGNLRRAARAHIFQIVVEKRLNAPVRGTQQIPEHQVLLVIVAKQRARDLEKIGVGMAACGMAQRGQLQVDVTHHLGFRRNAVGFRFGWMLREDGRVLGVPFRIISWRY